MPKYNRMPAGRATGGEFDNRARDEAPLDLLDSTTHRDPAVRVVATYHPDLPRELRAAMLLDSHPEVREAALNAQLYGRADLAIAFDFALRLARSR